MKRILLVVGLVVVATVAIGGFLLFREPDLSAYESLREPRIHTMEGQRMLVVALKGDPNLVAGTAFSALMKAYYRLPGSHKTGHPPAPRARWQFPLETPKEQWVGSYGLPLPDAVQVLPAGTDPSVSIATWEYGSVAEILHVGPYSAEAPTIEKLTAFLTGKGFRIIGDHEEEYLRGPGMFGKGDPAKYYPIIRYRIEKAG